LLSISDIVPLHLANVTPPRGKPMAGQRCPVYAFVIVHPEGQVLVDSGVGQGNIFIDRWYRPQRRPLPDVLAEHGLSSADIALVINTHLHFDHCGENRLFPHVPIFVQALEYTATHDPDYTVSEWVDFPDAKIEQLTGECEVLPGVTIVPTHGHTRAHQSVVLDTNEGPVVIAGQAAYSAAEFADPQAGHTGGLGSAWDEEEYLASILRLRALEPQRVYFSHDRAVWQPA
jgi:glyoxylase-like metal-dependent hydrolase (beta-lactamase superfamily II)